MIRYGHGPVIQAEIDDWKASGAAWAEVYADHPEARP